MNGLILAAYGVYLLLVGFNGNSGKMLDMSKSDAGGFLPWAVSIAVLATLYNNDYTKKVAEPFIFLLILTFILTNFDNLKSQYAQIAAMASKSSTVEATP